MNLSNSDCAARYDVTNADGTIDYNPLEAHTRGSVLPDFSSKIKVSLSPCPQNHLHTKTFPLYVVSPVKKKKAGKIIRQFTNSYILG